MVDGGPNGGMSSLLEPGHATKHGRKASVVSYTSTVPDEKPGTLSPTPSGTTGGMTLILEKKKLQKLGDNMDDATPHHIEPSKDHTDPVPFEQKPLVLTSLVDPKNLPGLQSMGGAEGLLRGLRTNPNLGLRRLQYSLADERSDPKKGEGGGAGVGGYSPITCATVEDRQCIYGTNTMPSWKSKGLLLLMWLALQDKVLVLLSIAAVVLLALGLYLDLGTTHEPMLCDDGVTQTCQAPKVDWVEGVAIIIAIFIVVIVCSLNNWQKERQFRKLNNKKEDCGVKVIRDGKEHVINIKDVLVSDIVLMEPREIILCDGVFLRGHNVRCNASGATGELDAIKKVTYEDCIEESKNLKAGGKAKLDCFIVSGSKILKGVSPYIVIAIGPKSFNRRIMAALSGDTESTPLQLKLNALAELIAKLGSAAGLILFTALMIKFFVQLRTRPNWSANHKAMSFVQILIISITLIVVAVAEGEPLAVTPALAFATKRMTNKWLLVSVLRSCKTMANASVVYTNRTRTRTQNVTPVVAGSVDVYCKFVQHLSENKRRQNLDHALGGQAADSEHNGSHKNESILSLVKLAEVNSVVQGATRSIFNKVIAVSSTVFEPKGSKADQLGPVGSQAAIAWLTFAWGSKGRRRYLRSTNAFTVPIKTGRCCLVVCQPGRQHSDVQHIETVSLAETKGKLFRNLFLVFCSIVLKIAVVTHAIT